MIFPARPIAKQRELTRCGYSSGGLPKVKLLHHIAKAQPTRTTLSEAVPLLFDLAATIPPEEMPPTLLNTDEFQKILRTTIVPNAIYYPFYLEQNVIGEHEPDFEECIESLPEVPYWVTNIMLYEPVPPVPRLRDLSPYRYYRAFWRRPYQDLGRWVDHVRPWGKPGLYYDPERLRKVEEAVGRPPRVTFHLMRHGEATHNILPRRDYNSNHGKPSPASLIPNPPLTPNGLRQSLLVTHTFPSLHKITHIFSSPLRRTLQTALAAFSPILYPQTPTSPKIIAWQDLREWGNRDCNTGSPLPELQAQMKGLPVDFTMLNEGWEHNNDLHCPCCRRVRSTNLRLTLFHLQNILLYGGTFGGITFPPHTPNTDLHVVLVSHGAFLSSLKYAWPVESAPQHIEGLEGDGTMTKGPGQWFINAEICSCFLAKVGEEWPGCGEGGAGIWLVELGGVVKGSVRGPRVFVDGVSV